MHIWTAPFCVVCLLFALAWASCPFVSGRASKARPSGGVGLHIWAGWRSCGVLVVVAFMSVCLSFCLWPRQYGGTLRWMGWGGRGWRVWMAPCCVAGLLACLSWSVCPTVWLSVIEGAPFAHLARPVPSGLAVVCLSGWGNLPLCLWVCMHVWSSVCIAPASLALVLNC